MWTYMILTIGNTNQEALTRVKSTRLDESNTKTFCNRLYQFIRISFSQPTTNKTKQNKKKEKRKKKKEKIFVYEP
jgi:hypothetical protein